MAEEIIVLLVACFYSFEFSSHETISAKMLSKKIYFFIALIFNEFDGLRIAIFRINFQKINPF
jgi:hypothetical protein